MQQHELEQLMADSAKDAVETSKDMFDVTLDFSPDSIEMVDNLLLAFVDRFKDQALEDNAVFTLCNIYGAYIGEVMKSIIGGQWRYDDSDKAAPFVVLDVGLYSYAFAGICYERLVNDSQVSVKAYFDQALANNTQ
ncbi:hypothetical protein [Alteromonas lipolytica]|uniref:DUF3806 domain-containing protein n=1 Tax=Alteromonas lipolytica TaxID=1856405 RepID=A0A1E8FHW5_9ALTE|nr:hypothetical protein [Alteromonas lipolytica]OFI35073.1 hypothetical protein BFC17_16105 [Alteromonas lipolytica]GGF56409.1 hypothetical protein GCM10011338_05880 [Alteromonas lipolytica]